MSDDQSVGSDEDLFHQQAQDLLAFLDIQRLRLRGHLPVFGFDTVGCDVYACARPVLSPYRKEASSWFGPNLSKFSLAFAEALADIHAGRREPKVVSVMAYVATALLNAIKTADREERIVALERCSTRE